MLQNHKFVERNSNLKNVPKIISKICIYKAGHIGLGKS